MQTGTYPAPHLIVAAPRWETGDSLDAWLSREEKRIQQAIGALAPGGSLCWQVSWELDGRPALDLMLGPVLRKCGLVMRNRILCMFGQDPADPGASLTVDDSGHRAVLWFTRPEGYYFDLPPEVRIKQRYTGKKHYKGPNKGKLSCNPDGKNPGDVFWIDPQQREAWPVFPPTVVKRLTLALVPPGGTVCVLDPAGGAWEMVQGLGREVTFELPSVPDQAATLPLVVDPVWRLPVGARRYQAALQLDVGETQPAADASPHVQPRYRQDGAPVTLHWGDCRDLTEQVPQKKVQLILISPPYNIGEVYERRRSLREYRDDIVDLIQRCASRLADDGTFAWQVGNYVYSGSPSNAYHGAVVPLDELFHSAFMELGFKVHRRVTWYFRHGLHCTKRFSGRYESVIFYTRTDNPVFMPEFVPEGDGPCWAIPQVNSNHCEKTIHPCQFPLELASRVVLSRSRPGDLVMDGTMGVGTSLVSAFIWARQGAGADLVREYVAVAVDRIEQAAAGTLPHRQIQWPNAQLQVHMLLSSSQSGSDEAA